MKLLKIISICSLIALSTTKTMYDPSESKDFDDSIPLGTKRTLHSLHEKNKKSRGGSSTTCPHLQCTAEFQTGKGMLEHLKNKHIERICSLCHQSYYHYQFINHIVELHAQNLPREQLNSFEKKLHSKELFAHILYIHYHSSFNPDHPIHTWIRKFNEGYYFSSQLPHKSIVTQEYKHFDDNPTADMPLNYFQSDFLPIEDLSIVQCEEIESIAPSSNSESALIDPEPPHDKCSSTEQISAHDDKSVTVGFYECYFQFCTHESKTCRDRKRHVFNTNHMPNYLFECTHCHQPFLTYDKLIHHLKDQCTAQCILFLKNVRKDIDNKLLEHLLTRRAQFKEIFRNISSPLALYKAGSKKKVTIKEKSLKKSIPNNQEYSCYFKDCDTRLRTPIERKIHIFSHKHTPEKLINCGLCYQLLRYRQLKKHFTTIHNNLSSIEALEAMLAIDNKLYAYFLEQQNLLKECFKGITDTALLYRAKSKIYL